MDISPDQKNILKNAGYCIFGLVVCCPVMQLLFHLWKDWSSLMVWIISGLVGALIVHVLMFFGSRQPKK